MAFSFWPIALAIFLFLIVAGGLAVRFALSWSAEHNNKLLIRAAETGKPIQLGQGMSAHVDLFRDDRPPEEPELVGQLLKTKAQFGR
jgi:hypothetical protein